MNKYVKFALSLICAGHALMLFPFFTYLIVTGNLLTSQDAGVGFTIGSTYIVFVSVCVTFIKYNQSN